MEAPLCGHGGFGSGKQLECYDQVVGILPSNKAKVVLPSEKGLLELAGRSPDLPLRDALLYFRDLVSADMDWADSRKARFRTRASALKVTVLSLTATSTVVLGIDAIPGRATIALPMVALVTLLSGFEAFFNWRSRWVLMEEAQYRLNRLRDDMDCYLIVTPTADLTRRRFDEFYDMQQGIWAEVSRRWVEFRRAEDQTQGTTQVDSGAASP